MNASQRGALPIPGGPTSQSTHTVKETSVSVNDSS